MSSENLRIGRDILRNAYSADNTAAWMANPLSAVALLVPTALPALLGNFQSRYGLSDRSLGYLASVELFGIALGALAGPQLLRGLTAKRVIAVGFVAAAIANALMILVLTDFLIFLIRTVSGIGAGIATSVGVMLMGRARDVDRVFGIYLFLQGVIGVGSLYAIALFPVGSSVPPLMVAVSAIFLVAAFFALMLPVTAPFARAVSWTLPTSRVMAGLLGIVLFYCVQGGLWAFIGVIGAGYHLPIHYVDNSIALSALVGMFGALFAGLIGARIGRALPLLVSLILSVAAVGSLIFLPQEKLFAPSVCLLNFAWNVNIPYLSAILAAEDATGASLAMATTAAFFGLAIGPAFAGIAIGRVGANGVLTASAAMCVFSVLCFVPALLEPLDGCYRSTV